MAPLLGVLCLTLLQSICNTSEKLFVKLFSSTKIFRLTLTNKQNNQSFNSFQERKFCLNLQPNTVIKTRGIINQSQTSCLLAVVVIVIQVKMILTDRSYNRSFLSNKNFVIKK